MAKLIDILKNFWAWFIKTQVYEPDLIPVPPLPVPQKPEYLELMCQAIQVHEGYKKGEIIQLPTDSPPS